MRHEPLDNLLTKESEKRPQVNRFMLRIDEIQILAAKFSDFAGIHERQRKNRDLTERGVSDRCSGALRSGGAMTAAIKAMKCGKWQAICLVLIACAGATTMRAQTETATVSGLITDNSGAVVPSADVKLESVERGIVQIVSTNSTGIYMFATVQPGRYQITVQKPGFRQVDFLGLIVNVQDHIEQNFRLQLGSVSESITVEANGINMNTSDASVSTLVDQHFAENLPLNGRSFNTLLELVPGVQIVNASNALNPGQFSVNGQRSDANYFAVDGVSANFGSAQGNGTLYQVGSMPALNSFGGTSALVSVDELQEFRVQTSSFAPEYGRTPGAQVEVSTRSGTNSWHGNLFDYFRNDALDANDWFNDQAHLPKSPLRQNDFGGTLGGPIRKDKTFFFFSYEGLRLLQPQTQVLQVPSDSSRTSAPSGVASLLNAFPQPNGADLGDGFANYTQSASTKSTLDTWGLRFDDVINSKLSIFGRVHYAPSEVTSRVLDTLNPTNVPTFTATVGATLAISPIANNQLRVNYSYQTFDHNYVLTTADGAQIPDLSELLPSGILDQRLFTNFQTYSAANPNDQSAFSSGPGYRSRSNQFNIVDDFSYVLKNHSLKFGVDFRRTVPTFDAEPLGFDFSCSLTALLNQTCDNSLAATTGIPSSVSIVNWSLYAQDAWKVGSRIVATYGVRWDFNPSPTTINNSPILVAFNADNPPLMSIAPLGTPFWKNRYNNFAPRLGIAYKLNQSGTLVVRGGVGQFYDVGTNAFGSQLANNSGTNGFNFLQPISVSLPLANAEQYVIAPSVNPPYGGFYFANNLKLPYSIQWNVAAEFAFAKNDAITVNYVGQAGRNLIQSTGPPVVPPQFGQFTAVVLNAATSDYDALQLTYQHRISHGLQALANYSWGHSIDTNSNAVLGSYGLLPGQTALASSRANSDFDVRHSASLALSYDLPGPHLNRALSEVLSGWGFDSTVYARTGFPIDISEADPTPQYANVGLSRPDLVPGQPFWVSDPSAPGGKRINVEAFTLRPPDREGDLPRNAVSGLPFWQWDFSLRRRFQIKEHVSLLFRVDAFNILNHPNFANPTDTQFSNAAASDPNYGISSQMLNQGLGGISPQYQIGGPRSLQVALKCEF